MRVSCLALCAVLALGATAAAGDAPAAAGVGKCSLAGTWYGGSDPIYPFLWTFTPVTGNRYTSLTQMGTDFRSLGYTTWTEWTGEVVSAGRGAWDSWGMSFWVWDPVAAAAAGVDGSLPELDVVRSRIEMTDCDTFTSTIDVYAAYFAWTVDRTPFTEPYDLSWLPEGGTLIETYHRLPRLPKSPASRMALTQRREAATSVVVPRKR